MVSSHEPASAFVGAAASGEIKACERAMCKHTVSLKTSVFSQPCFLVLVLLGIINSWTEWFEEKPKCLPSPKKIALVLAEDRGASVMC